MEKEIFQIREDSTFIAQGLSIPIQEMREITIKKPFRGIIIEIFFTIYVVILLIYAGIIIFADVFWGYILISKGYALISMLIAFAGGLAIEYLQEKFGFALQIITPYNRFEIKDKKDNLEKILQAIKTRQLSKTNNTES